MDAFIASNHNFAATLSIRMRNMDQSYDYYIELDA